MPFINTSHDFVSIILVTFVIWQTTFCSDWQDDNIAVMIYRGGDALFDWHYNGTYDQIQWYLGDPGAVPIGKGLAFIRPGFTSPVYLDEDYKDKLKLYNRTNAGIVLTDLNITDEGLYTVVRFPRTTNTKAKGTLCIVEGQPDFRTEASVTINDVQAVPGTNITLSEEVISNIKVTISLKLPRANTTFWWDSQQILSCTETRLCEKSDVNRTKVGSSFQVTYQYSYGSNQSDLFHFNYQPLLPDIEGIPSSPLIEKEASLNVTCQLTGYDVGNPPAHVYHWSNLDTSYNRDTTSNKLELSGITVRDHNGQWQCKAENSEGTGPARNFKVTVNARANITTDLPVSTSAVADDLGSLSVTCGFTSKPGATITWQYNVDQPLPAGVTTVRQSAPDNSPYSTVQEELVWTDPSDIQVRRQAGGRYRCKSDVNLGSVSDTKYSREMELNVEYSPYNIRLSGGGPSEVAVAGQPAPVTRTCQADCRPDCTYRWGNHTNSNLTFYPVDKDDHGVHTCWATNKHSYGDISVTFNLTVNYLPEIRKFDSGSGSSIQFESSNLTCTVSSRPTSGLNITYKPNGTVLTSQTGQRVQYTFTSVQCLDTGVYTCSANNGIGGNDVKADYYLDVRCPFSPMNQSRRVFGALGDNQTSIFTMMANPFHNISRNNLTFMSRNSTFRTNEAPENVEVFMTSTDHDVVKHVHFFVKLINECNFGLYSLTMSNEYGPSAVIDVFLEPQGPPSVPSVPRLLYATAVSLNLEWTAGFNGGLPQTFTVMYINQKTDQEHTQLVNTDPGVSSGDVVSHKLQNSLTPDTNFTVWIKAENQFEEKSGVAGPPEIFTSDPASGFVGNTRPKILLDSNGELIQMDLNLLNPEYLTSVVCEVCTTDNPVTCNRTNHTDLSVQEVVVPLPDSSVQEYLISVYMFDREDAVFNDTWTVNFHHHGHKEDPSIGVVVGCTCAAIIVITVLIVFFVLWRKDKIPLKRKLTEASGSSRLRDDQQMLQVNVADGSIISKGIHAFEGLVKEGDKTLNNKQHEDVEPNQNGPNDVEPQTDTKSYKTYANSAVTAAAFGSYVAGRKHNMPDFRNEYKSLPGPDLARCAAAQIKENNEKNRYKNIYPYDENIVLLKTDDLDRFDYINANYISGYFNKKEYIATQGPVKKSVVDFWRMIWQERADRIVMLAKLTEDMKVKCIRYWPENVGERQQFGDFRVTTESIESSSDFAMRTLSVQYENDVMMVRQFHFLTWPDKARPTYGETSLLEFRRKVRAYDQIRKGPIVVHCSAGVGRTGTFIALDILLEQMKEEKSVDIYCRVKKLRTQRMMMVQTMDQYAYLHDVLAEFTRCGQTSIPCSEFEDKYRELCQPEGLSVLQTQFENLCHTVNDNEQTQRDGLVEKHQNKNRRPDVIPFNSDRPVLPGPLEDSYINAVFVDSVLAHDHYVVTQMPLPNTIEDFWRLIHNQGTNTIVMLNQIDEHDQTCQPYWPEKGETQVYGAITVTSSKRQTITKGVMARDFIVKKLSARQNHTDSGIRARHFHITSWPDNSVFASKPRDLLDLVEHVTKWQQENESVTAGYTVVHCIDGVQHSGMFCAMMYMMANMKSEQFVDPFLAARCVARNRPQFFETLDQYQFLYQMAKAHLDHYNEYVNFQ